MTGTDIGSYHILEKLGEGGMGVVYKAVDTSLDRTVAIKVLNSDLSHNPDLVARFRNEAKAQANLNHTNLATLFAFLAQDGTAAMVMEYVDGETFEQMVMRRGPMQGVAAVPLFKQALLGIGYAHRSGIVHRDIKPSNLMVNRMGIVKVMDFGIAKVMGTRGATRTGTQMGTAWYMSPEQVMNKPVDIRSDIYSLGVTLYQMVSAHVPFEADSDFQIMLDHVHTAPPLPTKFYPYIPKGIENAILKAIEKDPDARFQTVEEFGSALERPEDFTDGSKTAIAPLPVTAQAPNPPSRPPRQAPPPVPPAPPAWPAPSPPAASRPHTPPPSYPPVPPRTQAEHIPPAVPVPPPMTSTTPAWPGASAASAAPINPAVSRPHAPPPPHATVYEQPHSGFVPPAVPIPPQPLGKPFLLTPAGIAVAGGAMVLLLAIAGWIIFRPKAADSASTSHSTLPPRTPTPLEQQMSTPPQVTQLSSAPTVPKVNAFRPASSSVPAGQTVHLTWSVSGASEVTISPGIGSVKPEGSVDIPLSRTTEFTLVAKNEKGEAASSSTTVVVEPPPVKPPVTGGRATTPDTTPQPPPQPAPQPPPERVVTPPPPPVAARPTPEIAFSAAPDTVQQGGSVTLRWYLTNANSASISPAPGVLRQIRGEYQVTPAQSTTYTLTATSKDGITSTATATVRVVAAAAPPPPVRQSVTISVFHDHGGAFVQNRPLASCWGLLMVNGNHLIYRVVGNNDGRRDDFDIQLTQIQEVKLNRAAIRNQPAFHVTVGGQHYNFIPQSTSAAQAASMIEAAAQGR